MDDQDFTGSPSEFLSIVSETAPDVDALTPPTDQASAAPADATDDTFAEEDDGLSPEERVAAVLAQDAEDYGATPEPEVIAEPDGDEDDEASEGYDLDTLTPEELRALAEEALSQRAEKSEREVDAEQQALVADVQQLDMRVTQHVQERFQREVLAVSEGHYGQLLAKEAAALYLESQEKDNPEGYFAQNLQRRQTPILRAQRAWEEKKAAEWEPVIEREITAARKQHPGLRQQFAQHLATDRNLPQQAVERLLRYQSIEDMANAADDMVESIKARAKQKRQESQKQREAKAKEVSRAQITPPVTGKPASHKPAELKGEYAEWLAIKAS
jgi:hypothetical protein